MTRKEQREQKREAKQENTRAQKAHREWKKTFKEIMRDLWLNDWFIKIGLAVSGWQLAIAFYYPGYPLSAISAIGKAAFVEGGVWLINRAIVWARVVKIHWAWKSFLWFILAVLMFISVRANLDYENEKKLAVKYPDAGKNGNPVIVTNARNVAKFLDTDEQADAWFRGGLVPLIVFASILVRRVMTSAADEYQREETRRFRESERQRGYRTERKKIVETLGGE
ncbi:MAG: hypothetical protein IPJ01_12265 [Micavibrio sp.]|nr:hypothetical protein [Micavibrio sp.]